MGSEATVAWQMRLATGIANVYLGAARDSMGSLHPGEEERIGLRAR